MPIARRCYFLRDDAHRAELIEWLRLSRAHPRYQRDGLNAEAMQLSGVEAFGAGLVLGPLFRPLDRVGLAAPLVRETGKTASAAGDRAVSPSGRRGRIRVRSCLLSRLAGDGAGRPEGLPDVGAGRLGRVAR